MAQDQWVQFWWQSGSPSGSRSPKSEIRIHWIIELPTDFGEISWRVGVWLKDQLITFWWRSASLSGSGSPFRITIRIREELPRLFYYAGVRRRSVLSEYFYSSVNFSLPTVKTGSEFRPTPRAAITLKFSGLVFGPLYTHSLALVFWQNRLTWLQ